MKFSLAFMIALALSGAVNIRATPVRSSSGLNDKPIKDLLATVRSLKFPDSGSKSFLRGTRANLHDDLEDFLAILPVDEITAIALDYVQNDAEIQKTLEYMQSDDFHKIVVEVEAMKEAHDVLAFLQESGLDAYGFLNSIHGLLGFPPFVPSFRAVNRISRATGGLSGLIADIKAILPMEKIEELYEYKLKNSPPFVRLIERLSSAEFQEFIDAVLAKEEALVIIAKLKSHGVDLQSIADLLTSILGLKFPEPTIARGTRANLHDDLDDFLAVLPVDEITAIALDYVQNDPEIQKTLEYMQSDDFHKIVVEVEAMKEARDVLAFLQESGLDAYGFLNSIHGLLEFPPFVPSFRAGNRISRATGGLSGLIADIKAILPMEKIEELYEYKLKNSPPFVRLIERLSSAEFQEFIDAVLAKEEALVIIAKLKSHGVDLQAIADLLTSILGLKFPEPTIARGTRANLHDDLDDFLAILPVDEITAIALDYVQNDPEIQKTLEYMQSDDFHKIVVEVEAMKEARDVLAFLQESGLDAYGFLNSIHGLLEFPPFVPSFRAGNRISRATGGLSGLIADIKAILPMEKIEELYEYKLKNSPPFVRLIERLSSAEFQEFIDAVLAKEEALVIIAKLKSHGVDLQAIADLLTSILGLKFPEPTIARGTRANLHDDLEDFLAILPVDEITAIALDYVQNDPEIQKTLEYMQSDDFHKIVVEVEAMKEARDVLAFLQESGLDAYGFLNSIHGLLEFPPFVPSFRAVNRISRATGGLSGLIADIKAILPMEKIEELYEYKLKNSPPFVRLIERLSSAEFQEFIDAVLAKEEALVIIAKLKSHGVDLQAIADLLTSILGLKFPEPTIVRRSEELVRDLADFLALVPLQDVIDVSIDYLFHDVEIQKAAAYVRGNEFKSLATNAEQNDEFRNFLRYLDGSGLPAFEWMNKLNEFLAIPQVTPSSGLLRPSKTGHGVRGLLDDIESLIPRKQVKQMYDHKMKTSKAFIFFIERLKAPEFQAVVDKLVVNKAFQKLGYRAAELGIDLKAIIEFMARVFGIEISSDLLPTRSARSLEDDFQEFVDLLPVKKIRKIAVKHYLFDREFRRVYAYVQSEEFFQLIRNLHEIPEYNELLKSLEETGLDVEGLIAQIHKAIGFQSIRSSDEMINARGIASFITEVKAVLPMSDIKALYEKKLETSEDFVRLVELISSKEFQAVTDALFADETFKYIVHQLESYGVDLKVVSNFFLNIFGIKTPPGIIN